jgi:hypothetical protein
MSDDNREYHADSAGTHIRALIRMASKRPRQSVAGLIEASEEIHADLRALDDALGLDERGIQQPAQRDYLGREVKDHPAPAPHVCHFDIHEDIPATRNHLLFKHYVTPVVPAGEVGPGPAEMLANQHATLHPYGEDHQRRVVVRGRKDMENVSVHLANEHGVSGHGTQHELYHQLHMQAHMYGQFRPGEAHVHEKPDTR